jgi:hypothetical protein
MPAISFPKTREDNSELQTGDVFTSGDKSWEYDAAIPAWKVLPVIAPTASGVPFTPAGSIAATNVQSALAELDGDVAGKQDALGFTPAEAGHTHVLADVTDYPDEATQDEMTTGTEAAARVMSPLRVKQAIAALADAEVNTANVTAAGALMDSEVTNLAAVKAFDPDDYATAAHTHPLADLTGVTPAAIGAVQSNITGIAGADVITNVVSLTQAEHDAIGTPDASTLYVITS